MVVTTDPLLLALMRGQGLHALEDTGGGLNAALGFACRHAAERGARAIVVLPSDLPTCHDRRRRGAAGRAWRRTGAARSRPTSRSRAPTRWRSRRPRADFFRFGPESFQAHLAAAGRASMAVRILRRPGLALDLDTPENYRRFAKEQRIPSGALA